MLVRLCRRKRRWRGRLIKAMVIEKEEEDSVETGIMALKGHHW